MPLSPRILLVEDDPFVRDLVAMMLRDAAFAVDEAAGGRAALELVGAHSAPDVLVTDLLMPAMSGRRLADALRSEHPQLPVLYLSGDDAEIVDDPAVAAGSAAFLQKPFSAEALAGAVNALLAA